MPEVAAPASVASMLRDAAASLAAAGCGTPRLDAELLLAEALGCDRAALVRDARDPVPSGAHEAFQRLLARRAAREPVAYILGRKEFRRITLEVDPRVLIPRPETELLVEVGLTLPAGAKVADVGTGSGAVALALKDERPDLDVAGIDADPDALAVARGNAARLGLDVHFLQVDLLDDEPYDAVLANLPYVEAGAELAPELAYEPGGALFAGRDGLEQIRRLIARLGDARVAALEVGAGQAPAVEALLAPGGFAHVERLRDLAGHERVVVARR